MSVRARGRGTKINLPLPSLPSPCLYPWSLDPRRKWGDLSGDITDFEMVWFLYGVGFMLSCAWLSCRYSCLIKNIRKHFLKKNEKKFLKKIKNIYTPLNIFLEWEKAFFRSFFLFIQKLCFTFSNIFWEMGKNTNPRTYAMGWLTGAGRLCGVCSQASSFLWTCLSKWAAKYLVLSLNGLILKNLMQADEKKYSVRKNMYYCTSSFSKIGNFRS